MSPCHLPPPLPGRVTLYSGGFQVCKARRLKPAETVPSGGQLGYCRAWPDWGKKKKQWGDRPGCPALLRNVSGSPLSAGQSPEANAGTPAPPQSGPALPIGPYHGFGLLPRTAQLLPDSRTPKPVPASHVGLPCAMTAIFPSPLSHAASPRTPLPGSLLGLHPSWSLLTSHQHTCHGSFCLSVLRARCCLLTALLCHTWWTPRNSSPIVPRDLA